MGFCFFAFFVVRPSSPRILPVCYAALCLLLIYVFTYRKKILGGGRAKTTEVFQAHIAPLTLLLGMHINIRVLSWWHL